MTRVGRGFAVAISGLLMLAMLMNFFSPASFLYTELTGLRQLTLPWGEQFWLATGEDNPLRFITELALLAVLVVVADGCFQFWTQKATQTGSGVRHRSGGVHGCFGTHAFLVDTGRLDFPISQPLAFWLWSG